MITFVMPVYNNRRYVHAALMSILNQTYRDIEVIVVDDASTDGTADIVSEMVRHHRQVRILRHQENRGCAQAVKTGISEANGEIILLQGADDISFPDRADAAISIMAAKPKAGIVVTDALIIDRDSNLTGEMHTLVELEVCEVPLLQWKRNYCLGATMAIRNRSELLLAPGILEEVEDYQISLEFILSGWNIAIDNRPRVFYRIHKDNLSNDRPAIMERLIRCLARYDCNKIYSELQRRGFAKQRIDVALGIFELFRNRPEPAAVFLNRAQDELLPKVDLFEKEFYLGVIAWLKGKTKESDLKFRSAYLLNQKEPTVLNNLAVHQAISGKCDEAIELFKISLKFYPNYIDAQYNLERFAKLKNDFRITERILDRNKGSRTQCRIADIESFDKMVRL